MKLEQFDNGQWQPSSEADMPLFLHCSGGMVSVTDETLKKTVIPLLKVHGVLLIEVTNAQGKRSFYDFRTP